MDMTSRSHPMRLDEQYFQTVQAGLKRTEIRVADPKRLQVKVGDRIEFTCMSTGETVAVTVTRLARYASFDALYEAEDASAVNPRLPAADQIAGLRELYPPEKEALGVLAIGIALTGSTRKQR
ncbi:ASCH domain-containing protein [Glycomyces sp. YM15]|uniref:ASCH domain-containing protein n=1 Tax=Glycomyces sp. YM15 TaxID=2800446 RepID=UPI001965905B|nr:ASCH domain-containing protein [Glycomyces sp. YM15]